MDNCKHVVRMSPSSDHSVLNPQKWLCGTCGTTESVWACLSCSNVACGRFIEEHAVHHYNETKHSLAIEVNDKYVYCYECGDYVLNDNPSGDIKILRNCLKAVATQSFSSDRGHRQRLLRSYSYNTSCSLRYSDNPFHDDDLAYTALWFRRHYMLAKAFVAWRQNTREARQGSKTTPEDSQKSGDMAEAESTSNVPLTRQPSLRRKRCIIPGVTGLRNLGNTCYMNAILQVLRHLLQFRSLFTNTDQVAPQGSSARPSEPWDPSHTPSLRDIRRMHEKVIGVVLCRYSHLDDFRDLFLALEFPKVFNERSKQNLQRQTTLDCFEYVNSGDRHPDPGNGQRKGGLNGGATTSTPSAPKTLMKIMPKKSSLSLSQELNALLRVMWSGQWALVSPHKMLYTIWHLIPFFKGYAQQDAQEFLCEFLDKVKTELERIAPDPSLPVDRMHKATTELHDMITKMFQGELISEVQCLRCGHKSQSFEMFMDLSLEFPDRCQPQIGSRISLNACHIEEMLHKFTHVEELEGKIYACEQCNKKRRRVSVQPVKYTEVQKQLLLWRLPHVLRLHLKRFMWSGRNNRGKISNHVEFEQELDLSDFCHPDLNASNARYRLSAMVMHHGRGFGCGHYTAFCWNHEADSWVHCNDAKVTICSIDDVRKSQAYILVYTRQDLTPDGSSESEDVDDEVSFKSGSLIPKFVELKRKMNRDPKGRYELKRRKTTVW